MHTSVFNTWFLGRPEIVDFWGLGGPGGPNNHSRRWGASPPTFWNGFGGRRGRPNPTNQRFPAGPKTMYKQPKRIGPKGRKKECHWHRPHPLRGCSQNLILGGLRGRFTLGSPSRKVGRKKPPISISEFRIATKWSQNWSGGLIFGETGTAKRAPSF